MWLWTNLSASLISSFLAAEWTSRVRLPWRFCWTQTQSCNGRASSDFQILALLSDAETPPPYLPPWTKPYHPLPTSSCGRIHSKINSKPPFIPPPWWPGMGLSTSHAVSHFIIKTPQKVLFSPISRWRNSGSERLWSWGPQGGERRPVGEVTGRFWLDTLRSFPVEPPLERWFVLGGRDFRSLEGGRHAQGERSKDFRGRGHGEDCISGSQRLF